MEFPSILIIFFKRVETSVGKKGEFFTALEFSAANTFLMHSMITGKLLIIFSICVGEEKISDLLLR